MIPTTFIEVMIVNLGLAIFLLASQLMWTKVPTLLGFFMDYILGTKGLCFGLVTKKVFQSNAHCIEKFRHD